MIFHDYHHIGKTIKIFKNFFDGERKNKLFMLEDFEFMTF